MDITDEFNDIWRKYDPISSEDGKFLISTFLENQKNSAKQYLKAYYVLVIISICYYFLDIKVINEIEIFSVKIQDLIILKWVISSVFCLFFYHAITSFIYETLYKQAIWNFVDEKFPELGEKRLHILLYSPSIINFEFFVASKFEMRIAKLFGLLLFACLIFIPLYLLIYIISNNLYDWDNVPSQSFKWLIISINFVILLRIISVIIAFLKSIFK
jgi:hypothetical protein